MLCRCRCFGRGSRGEGGEGGACRVRAEAPVRGEGGAISLSLTSGETMGGGSGEAGEAGEASGEMSVISSTVTPLDKMSGVEGSEASSTRVAPWMISPSLASDKLGGEVGASSRALVP